MIINIRRGEIVGKINIEKTEASSHNVRYKISEEGKSNFVDDKSLIKTMLKDYIDSGKKYPEVYGVPRSGSTLVRNILNTIFDGKVKVQRHHHFGNEVDKNSMVVASYRDPRDCVISKWRMNYGKFDNDKDKIVTDWDSKKMIVPDHVTLDKSKHSSVSNCTSAIKSRFRDLHSFDEDYGNNDNGYSSKKGIYTKMNKNILFVRYEQFNDNFDLLMNQFEEFFEIVIVKDLRNFVKDTWNKDRVKRVYSDSMSRGYELDTEIHAQHIYKGATGTWKEILVESDHSKINEALSDELKRWGYEL